MFKVVQDQLRVSEGWVRCGQCAEIFDASHNMLAPSPGQESSGELSARVDPSSEPELLPPAPRAPALAAREVATPPPGPADAPWHDTAGHARPMLIREPLLQPEPAQETAAPIGTPATTATPDPGEDDWRDAPVTDPLTAVADAQAVDNAPEPAFDAAPTTLGAVAAAADPRKRLVKTARSKQADISFMRDGAKSSFWRRRAVRWVLLVLVLLLLAALAVQLLIQQRDRIVSVEPAARPVLLGLCAWVGCELSPLRQIESIVIDSSSFSRVGEDTYRLGFALRNSAPVSLAMPAIELALTDAQDQVQIRRVVFPAEFGAGSQNLAAGADWNGSLSLRVKPDASATRVAGYRLLAFYP